jgi:alkanesulfonate monooxygenase SsuD/methylene tetrahydromethanopterin reductase-like flavin-dependent oxidoreductase (luciferase family)
VRFTPILIPGTPHGAPEKLDELVELIVLAEELGYDGVWITEHHGSIYGRPSPAVILAAAAGRTQRIRLGVAVIVLPWHHPLDVAADLATLDVLCGGRLEAGFGRGLFPDEFAFFDVPLAEGKGRFDEGLEFITQAWTQESASLNGEYWRIPEIRFVPRTAQQPSPPMWLVALAPPTIEMVIRRRANGLIGPYLTPFTEVKEQFLDIWHEKLAEAGIPPGTLELGHNQHVYVAESDEQAVAEAGEHLRWYCQTVSSCLPGWEKTRGTPFEHYTHWKERLLTLDGDALFKERAVMGGPERVIELVRFFERAGVTTFIPFMNFGTMPFALAKKNMTLFATEVMPAFRHEQVPAALAT